MQLGSAQIHGRRMGSWPRTNDFCFASAETPTEDAFPRRGGTAIAQERDVLMTLLCISLPLRLCKFVVFFFSPVVKAASTDSPVAPERSVRRIPEEYTLAALVVMVGEVTLGSGRPV